MGCFGENLRRERELRGATLPEIANATKIPLHYLQALEDDQFHRLPGGIFNRGFVRAVARYLKLDENHWVREFVRAAHEPPEIQARYAPPRALPSGSSRRARWSFALLVVIFGVGAYVIHDLRLQQAAEASIPAVRPAAPLTAAVTPPPSEAEVPPPTKPASQPPLAASPAPLTLASSPPTANPVPTTGDLRLQIDVVEDAWIQVIVDGQPNFEGLMKTGSTRNFHGTGQIELVTGNASAVVLTLNSETLAPLGNPGERKKVVLTAKDLRPPLR
jgi:cytoskeletal protein RodZ